MLRQGAQAWAAILVSAEELAQAFGSPVATTKIIGSLRTFASTRSSSLGSSLAAIETAGRQQSAVATHRIKLRIIVPLRAEHRREVLLCLHRPPCRKRRVRIAPEAHYGTLLLVGVL